MGGMRTRTGAKEKGYQKQQQASSSWQGRTGPSSCFSASAIHHSTTLENREQIRAKRKIVLWSRFPRWIFASHANLFYEIGSANLKCCLLTHILNQICNIWLLIITIIIIIIIIIINLPLFFILCLCCIHVQSGRRMSFEWTWVKRGWGKHNIAIATYCVLFCHMLFQCTACLSVPYRAVRLPDSTWTQHKER